jgi:DNA-3-methyladenine glycosylase II
MPEGVPTPEGFECLTDERLRAVGMSRQKSAYLRDLCSKVTSGTVALDALDALDDEEVIASLVKVKGIGRWSAEMFLIFRLLRPDVFPVDDLGIVTAVQRAYRLRKRPTVQRLRKIAEPWRPYRSVASWYLWRSLDNVAPGSE